MKIPVFINVYTYFYLNFLQIFLSIILLNEEKRLIILFFFFNFRAFLFWK